MTDKRGGPVSSALKFLLWICSLVYGLFVGILSRGYEKKFFTPYRPDPKVISVGNITVGGTGKTQAVITLANILIERYGKRPAVLIRGYGADEFRMLQEELKDVPVLVGPDRISNSKRAFYDFGADTVILDDGFQHFKIRRDLDIVLIDAMQPFGNGRLIPRGILREAPGALKRADLIIINKTDAEGAKMEEIYRTLEGMGKASCVLEAVYKPFDIYDLGRGRSIGLKSIEEKRLCLVSSIANPGYFRQNILNLGGRIELEFTFMDHYNYKEEDFSRIGEECRLFDAEFIIVTKKDAVKIKRLSLWGDAAIPILVLEVSFDIVKNENRLYDRLSGLYNG
ncbi:MAG: tetraacyldisaccharide 4'-kinase [Candidatus Omnitrophica bacterium]|nr:tetraacyldisaccharide 4'-kinase [Candidatus Omnitrophota bacterium]